MSNTITIDEITINPTYYKIEENKETLQHIILQNTHYIDDYAFADCTALEKIDLPDTVYDIGNDAFSNCKSLKEIIIPDSVTEIENRVFANCTSLEKITFPKTINYIGEDITKNCTSLKEINYNHINILDYCNPKYISDFLLKAVNIVAHGNSLNNNEKEQILKELESSTNHIEILEHFLYNKSFLDEIFENSLDLIVFFELSNEAINSDFFYEYAKDKETYMEDFFEDKDFAKITNYKLALVIFSNDFLFKHLDELENEVKYNKKFIYELFSKKNDNQYNLSCFHDTLNYFKNNNDIVGLFAGKLFTDRIVYKYTETDEGKLKDFLKCINCKESDVEQIKWLSANNMRFFNFLTEEEKENYILEMCCSFDNYTILKENEEYYLSSQFNELKIKIDLNYVRVQIKSKNENFYIVDWCFGQSVPTYNEIINSVKNTIKEIDKENLDLEK